MFAFNDFCIPAKNGVILSLYVQPGASENKIAGEFDKLLKIKLKAPPVENRANKELIRYLSELFKKAKDNFKILAGEKSRKKKILIVGLTAEGILEVLNKNSD